MPIQHIDRLRGEGEDEEFNRRDHGSGAWGQTRPSPLWVAASPRRRGGESDRPRALRLRYPSARPLYACVLRSPHPHARIRRIDISRAEALPGVHAVLSYANAPQLRGTTTAPLDPTVRFVGEEVAAVAAESEDIARDALG